MNKSYTKKCKKCCSKAIKKDWFKRWKQRYKCKNCWHVFQNKTRKQKIDISKLYHDYCFKKQTYSELSETYWISIKTVQTKLDEYKLIVPKVKAKEVILLIDTTYFWDFWVMVFKDAWENKIINIKIVDNENNSDYKNWVRELEKAWWIIKAIVCDWRKGLLTWFSNIPTQMCNFHQVAIVRRYITKKPILEANKVLNWITRLLVNTDRETFTHYLDLYWEKYNDFLKERRLNNKWKLEYIHKRTRAAYFSLKNNLKYLFTYYDYIWQIDIPNTTNWLEWIFGHIKCKIALHRWLKKERKIKLILSLLYGKI
jgi:hypothetical protein